MNFSINFSISAFDDEIPEWVNTENEYTTLKNLVMLWRRLVHDYIEKLYAIELYDEKISSLAAGFGQNVYRGSIPMVVPHCRPIASWNELSVCLRKHSLDELTKDAKECVIELTKDVNHVIAYHQSQLDLIKRISDYNHIAVPDCLDLSAKISDYSRSIFFP